MHNEGRGGSSDFPPRSHEATDPSCTASDEDPQRIPPPADPTATTPPAPPPHPRHRPTPDRPGRVASKRWGESIRTCLVAATVGGAPRTGAGQCRLHRLVSIVFGRSNGLPVHRQLVRFAISLKSHDGPHGQFFRPFFFGAITLGVRRECTFFQEKTTEKQQQRKIVRILKNKRAEYVLKH